MKLAHHAIVLLLAFSGSLAFAGLDTQVCDQMANEANKNYCYRMVFERGTTADSEALRLCRDSSLLTDSDRYACLNLAAQSDFQTQVVKEICAITFSNSALMNCLRVVQNKDYSPFVIIQCKHKFSEGDAQMIDCLRNNDNDNRTDRFGQQDSGDNYVVNLLMSDDYVMKAKRAEHTCTLYNSGNTKLGVVPKELSKQVASQYASHSGGYCVVLTDKGIPSHQNTLYDSTGEKLGSNLTVAETTNLKHQNGYSTCRIVEAYCN